MYITEEQYKIASNNGIRKETVYMRVHTYGWSIEKAITMKTMKKSECRRKYPIEVYESLEKNNIGITTFHSRIHRGWTVEDACTIKSSQIVKYSNRIKNKKFKYLSTGIKEIKKELFNPIANLEYSNKPSGGLWSAPYRNMDVYKSDWMEFCIESDFNKENLKYGVIFELKENTKIYTIDKLEDLEILYNKYKAKDINNAFNNKRLDFEKISKEYDALYLTVKGQIETRFGMDWFSSLNLYGWDCETMLVFNFDCIENQQYVDLE